MEKDLSPIDQEWINQYVGDLLKAGNNLAPGPFQDAVLRRAECVMDLVEAWRIRNNPLRTVMINKVNDVAQTPESD